MQLSKKEIRKQILEKRSKLTDYEVVTAGEKIYNKILESGLIKSNSLILNFASYKNEPDTYILFERLKESYPEVQIAYPKICNDNENMEYYLVQNIEQLCKGYMGIKEPSPCYTTKLINKDMNSKYSNILMLMPGLAFDDKGLRVGYGGGFYDRFLNRMSNYIRKTIIKLAVCHDFQIIEAGLAKSDVHDVKPDYIVTPKRLIKIYNNEVEEL